MAVGHGRNDSYNKAAGPIFLNDAGAYLASEGFEPPETFLNCAHSDARTIRLMSIWLLPQDAYSFCVPRGVQFTAPSPSVVSQ
jgi:hypothetical protein